MTLYKWSKYAFSEKKHNILACWNNLNINAESIVYLTQDQVKHLGLKDKIPSGKIFEAKETKLINELVTSKILCHIDTDEEKIKKNLLDKISSDIYPKVLYLGLTQACNLKCRYCFEKDNKLASSMNPELIIKAINFFAKSGTKDGKILGKQRSIIFFGGEPTLKKELIPITCNEIKKLQKQKLLPKDINLSIITNGTLINQELIDICKKYDVNIGISIDGDKDITDLNRGKGTYDKIKKGIELLDKNNLKAGASITLTFETYKHLLYSVQHIYEKLNIKDFSISLVIGPDYDNTELKKIYNALLKTYIWLRNKNIIEGYFGNKINAFLNKSFYPFGCAATGGHQLVVQSDGALGICSADLTTKKHYFGSLFDKEQCWKEIEEIKEWVKRTPLNIPECKNCSALGICGGGCPYNAELLHGSIWSVDSRYCLYNKMLLHWMIWSSYEYQKKHKIRNI